jgi:hypothetical protein
MHIPKLPSFSKNTLLITYKILHDALFLLLMSFIAMLVAEGALPGIISSHISFTRVVVAILLVLLLIILIGKKFQLVYATPVIKKNKLLPVLVFFAFLLIGNSLLKFALWKNIVITLSTLFLFFLFYQIIFESKN